MIVRIMAVYLGSRRFELKCAGKKVHGCCRDDRRSSKVEVRIDVGGD